MKLSIKNLEIEMDKDYSLYCRGEKVECAKRTIGDMKEVILDGKFLSKSSMDTVLYYMYRDVGKYFDPGFQPRYKIRYDITVIPPLNLGIEFNKTVGHYHPEKEKGVSYTELYQVVEGTAHYMLQRKENEKVADALLIKTNKGEIAYMPPNYGHITINPKKKPLVMANLVSSEFSSVYGEYKVKKGGIYYELANGEFIRNENYQENVPLVIRNADGKGDILDLFIGNPKAFEYLKDPKLIPKFF